MGISRVAFRAARAVTAPTTAIKSTEARTSSSAKPKSLPESPFESRIIADGLPLDETAVAHSRLKIFDRPRRAGCHDADDGHALARGHELHGSAASVVNWL